MSNTWYKVYPVPGKSGYQVLGVTRYLVREVTEYVVVFGKSSDRVPGAT